MTHSLQEMSHLSSHLVVVVVVVDVAVVFVVVSLICKFFLNKKNTH